MINSKICFVVCLGASLWAAGDRLSLTAKCVLMGGVSLFMGGAFHTLKIVIRTLPRDVRAVTKLVRLMLHVKRAESRNLTVPKMFAESVRKFPDKILFYFKDEEWTFSQVELYSNRVANYFDAAGFKKGDNVAIFMSNRPEFVCIWLGLAKIGVVPALINSNLRCDPLLHSINVVKSKAIIFTSELAQAVETIFGLLMNGSENLFPCYCLGGDTTIAGAVNLTNHLAATSDEPIRDEISNQIGFKDKLLYIYTSGTTGLPKAAVIKHSRYILAGGGLTIMMGVHKSDRVYCPLPLYHSVGGMISLSGCMNDGIPMIMREKFSATSYWRDCVRYKATAAQYIGEICRYLLNTPECEYESQHSVRLMFGNGLRPDIWQDFTQRFNITDISEFYGSTEGNSQVLNFDNTVGAVGFTPVLFSSFLPLGLIKVDGNGDPVRDENGLCIRCTAGEPGEFVGIIEQNHPLREFNGYQDETSTKRKVLYDVWKKGDSCFRSGDILVADKYGYLYFRDRKGDTFRWKGENVSTAEVESIISRSVNLTSVVVYGVTVPGCEGRAGMAAILEDKGTGCSVNLKTLADHMTEKLPSYARPVFVRLTHELDITGTFKLKKRDLQAEGYDITKVTDRLYFLKKGTYIPLTQDLYNDINEGRERF